MNNDKVLPKDNSILKKIGIFMTKIPIYFLRLPLWFFRSLQKVSQYTLKSFMYSIRRSLTASFLMIYTVISLFTFVIIISGFMFFELDASADELYYEVQQIAERYGRGIFDDEDLIEVIDNISLTDQSDIYISISHTDIDYKTKQIYSKTYPESFGKKISVFFSDKMYGSNYDLYVEKEGEVLDGQVIVVQPIKQFYSNISLIAVLYLVCFIFGFVVIWLFSLGTIKRMVSPLYTMTLTAKKMSISNMDDRLDVAKAKYELRDLALTLNDMLDRLQADYAKQKRFVSDVSHELRTPISIVTGYANMLERWGKEDEEILDESIEAIISEAKSMQILVENLLTLVRSDNQTLKYDTYSFNLSNLVSEVCKETAMINTKNQAISCDITDHIEGAFDFEKIKQMLRIFVDNAVKYTPETGQVRISCYEEDGKATIRIKDTGIGISNVDLPYLFDRFYRSDESRTRQTGGHGLGLSIAKVIVLGHGGSIRVKSKLDIGSEFIIELPLS